MHLNWTLELTGSSSSREHHSGTIGASDKGIASKLWVRAILGCGPANLLSALADESRTRRISRITVRVVSGVRRMNEVNARRARLVPGWVTVIGRVYHIGM